MVPVLVTIASATLAGAFLAFAWTMQRRQRAKGRVDDDSDGAIVGMFPGV